MNFDVKIDLKWSLKYVFGGSTFRVPVASKRRKTRLHDDLVEERRYVS